MRQNSPITNQADLLPANTGQKQVLDLPVSGALLIQQKNSGAGRIPAEIHASGRSEQRLLSLNPMIDMGFPAVGVFPGAVIGYIAGSHRTHLLGPSSS